MLDTVPSNTFSGVLQCCLAQKLWVRHHCWKYNHAYTLSLSTLGHWSQSCQWHLSFGNCISERNYADVSNLYNVFCSLFAWACLFVSDELSQHTHDTDFIYLLGNISFERTQNSVNRQVTTTLASIRLSKSSSASIRKTKFMFTLPFCDLCLSLTLDNRDLDDLSAVPMPRSLLNQSLLFESAVSFMELDGQTNIDTS
jgi:hypothetical protein